MNERFRFLPLSVGLGLAFGDLLTLSFSGQLTIRRAAVSGVIAVVAYYAAAWWVARRMHGHQQKSEETDG